MVWRSTQDAAHSEIVIHTKCCQVRGRKEVFSIDSVRKKILSKRTKRQKNKHIK